MARPVKETVDYFPHFVDTGKTIFVLESKFGNDGYSFWFKLLEILGKSNGHYYNCGNSYNLEFLMAKTRVSEDITNSILNTLATLGSIDQELWQNHKVIWCQNLVNNVAEVYRKRKTNTPTKPSFNEKGVIGDGNPSTSELLTAETQNNEVSDIGNRQSKVKESIVNKIKEKQTSWSVVYENNISLLTPMSIQIINKYIEEDGLSEELIIKSIEIAVAQNKRNLSYIEGILKNFIIGNIKTIEQYEKAKVEYKKKTDKKSVSYDTTQFQNLDEIYFNIKEA